MKATKILKPVRLLSPLVLATTMSFSTGPLADEPAAETSHAATAETAATIAPAEPSAAESAAAAIDGKAVYERACASCHKGGFGGFFTKAPKTGKRSAWEPLLAQRTPEEMLANTLAGRGKMEPRGGCSDCSDAEIRAAVEYMLDQVR